MNHWILLHMPVAAFGPVLAMSWMTLLMGGPSGDVAFSSGFSTGFH